MGSLRTAPTMASDAERDGYAVVERLVDAPHPVPVRDYEPLRPTSATPLVWLHGGGWVTGGLDAGESAVVGRALAARGRRVRTVDYRLAPFLGLAARGLTPSPHRFPAALDDVVCATLDLASAAAPVAIGGASAGAGLASAALLRLQGSDVQPCAAVLAYGALHATLPARSAEGRLGMLGIVAPEWASRWMYARFAGNYTGGPAVDAAHAFAGGRDLSRMPPTLVLDADHDPLRASGDAFARELADAGVTVHRRVEPGTWHGFLSRPGTPAFALAVDRIEAWLDRHDGGGAAT